jgi:hypothetical protein
VKRSEFAQILSSAEPVGVQLLREEMETLQCNIRALQREADFQDKHLATLAKTQAQDRTMLTQEYSQVKASIRAARAQVVVHEVQILEHEESTGRSLLVAECWNMWAPLVSSATENVSALLLREDARRDARLREVLELQRRFGNNPYPRDVYPMDWLVHTTVPAIIGWIAVIAAFWTTIIAPLLIGREYV